LNPAVESSLATTPPAAPDPTTTKSTSSSGLYWTVVVLSGASVGCLRSHIAVIPAEGSRPREVIVEAEHLPSRFVRVAAVFRIGEHSADGHAAKVPEVRALGLLHRCDDGVLLRHGQCGERLRALVLFRGETAEFGDELVDVVFLFLGKPGERLVDEPHDVRLARPGRAIARNDPRRSGVEVGRLIGSKDFVGRFGFRRGS